MHQAGAGLAAGLASALLLGGCQSWFIFETDRKVHASPADFPFKIVEITVPVGAERPQQLNGWWLPTPLAQAKTFLYFHGNEVNVSTSVREVTPLVELQYSVCVIDYRGFGKSDGLFPSEKSVYEDAEAVWNYAVRKRGIDPAQIYIYGQSLGSAIAIELARHHPEAAGLIVESGFTSIYDMARLDIRYRALPVNLFLNQRFESLRKVPELKMPVLFMHGTADEIVPYSMGEELFEAAPEPKRFVPLEDGKHDHDARAVPVIRDAIERFVRETARQRVSAAP
jgi:fermentation-respiration switch protein FrsA (DUF1100 family)